MGDKKTGIVLKVSAVNSTGRVFKNIAASAAGIFKSFASGAGMAVGMRAMHAVVDTIKELGSIADIAQSAQVTTDELTKLSNALSFEGVRVSAPEELASAFQRMTKATSQVGLEGFHNVVEAISKIPTQGERAAAAMKVFGRAGLQFMPIINKVADQGINSLKDLEGAVPGISDNAANACSDAIASFAVMWQQVKSLAADAIMVISNLIGSKFSGGIREAALIGAARMRYFASVGGRYVGTLFTNFRQVARETFEWFAKVIDNTIKAIGGLIVVGIEMAVSKAKSVLDDIAAGAAAVVAKMKGDKALEQQILHDRYLASKREEGERAKIWKEYKRLNSQLDWKYNGIMADIDISDLKEQLDVDIMKAKEVAESRKNGKGRNENLLLPQGSFVGTRRADNTNPEAIMGGSYKALTYAMRQGYATGIAEIKNLVKKAVDGIKGVKDAVEANNLELAAT